MVASKSDCPVCASAKTIGLFHQPAIPSNNSILCFDAAEARDWPVGSFGLTQCCSCGFLFNSEFDPTLVEYSGRIEETQAFSPHFVRYAESLAAEWIDRYDIRGQTVLEVGCGKAEFLSLMCEIGGNKGIGYDPAVHIDRIDKEAAARLTLVTELFDDEHVDLGAEALVCRHTLEHVPDVHAFLSMLHRWAVRRSEPPILLFEVPDVERVLDEVAFWDLFYEHCSYFTRDTLRFAFERAGFEVEDVRAVYDGQYLVLEARPRPESVDATAVAYPDDVAAVVDRAGRFVERYQSSTAVCRSNLQRFVDEGKTVVIWGAGSKAVSFLTNLEVGHLVELAVDVNPNKQGRFLVGTGHPVVGPEALRGHRDLQVIVMNPVYLSEVTNSLRRLDIPAEITSANDLLRGPVARLAAAEVLQFQPYGATSAP
ncbi:MAG TPA: class I SAM-dependent methyltransferase [Acidimicrobiales bacterium]|nr:class I SAM-dependent methyltransferase [Acidimicrobiales bacterium]